MKREMGGCESWMGWDCWQRLALVVEGEAMDVRL
jgi:hypothetical protein